ncbi:KTSC domain-containing protein [Mesorhizobium sp. M0808]|uniref:KTSC domain-containing protein n=1 Tax=Mesorhizobium sp. M0808 TaxID=2957002 RepID=UPI003336C5AF
MEHCRALDLSRMPSTAIRSIDYQPATRILSVWFVPSGNRHDYEDVPPQVHATFCKASSKGRFFNEHIRDRYKYHLVEQSHSS